MVVSHEHIVKFEGGARIIISVIRKDKGFTSSITEIYPTQADCLGTYISPFTEENCFDKCRIDITAENFETVHYKAFHNKNMAIMELIDEGDIDTDRIGELLSKHFESEHVRCTNNVISTMIKDIEGYEDELIKVTPTDKRCKCGDIVQLVTEKTNDGFSYRYECKSCFRCTDWFGKPEWAEKRWKNNYES